jgi:DivIVA domain-containing protein
MTKRPERPEFASSIRGYDRLQVDDYLDRLAEIAADAEDRARTAEAELEFSRHATVGPRVGQILELAVEEAQELRERVSNEAEQMRTGARRDAEAMAARAREAAAETEAEAARIGRETIARAQQARDEILGEVETLGEHKAVLLGDLERLQQILATAMGTAPAGSAEEGEASDKARAQGGKSAREKESAQEEGPAPGKRRTATAKRGAEPERAAASR